MTTYKTFNKVTLGTLRAELNALLAKFGAESGLMITIGNIRFAPDGTTMHTRLDAHVKGAVSTTQAQLGMTPVLVKKLRESGFGDTFVSPTLGVITLVDYHPRKPKFPFIGVRSDGKRFKFTYSQVAAGQENKALAARR